MSPLLRRALAAAAVCTALACGSAPEPGPAAAPAEEPFRVLLVGDSITEGTGTPLESAYPALLAEQLGPGFELVNLACRGTSTLDWTRSRGARFCAGEPTRPNLYEQWVRPALPADLVTVLLGTNDAQGFNEREPFAAEQHEAALREIAAQLLADGAARVMLIGPPPVIHRARASQRLFDYASARSRLCEQLEHVVCGPDLLLLLGRHDFPTGDLHPHAGGHAKIATALAPALRAQRDGSSRLP